MTSTPDSVSPSRPSGESSRRRDNSGILAAKACLYCPILVLIIAVCSNLIQPDASTMIVLLVVNFGLAVGGLSLGVVALVRMRRYGREGIFRRTIIGLALNVVVLAIIVTFGVMVHRMANRIRQRNAILATAAAVDPVYRLQMPDGFTKAENPPTMPDLVETYMKDAKDGSQGAVYVMIHRLDGLLPNKRIELSPGEHPGVSVLDATWQGHQIALFRITEELKGMHALTFNAQVPLTPRAIQVTVFGPKDREAELRETMQQVLDGLAGATNW